MTKILVAIFCTFFLSRCSDYEEASKVNEISFNSCNWIVGEGYGYKRVYDKTKILSFVSTDEMPQRTIDFYDREIDLISKFKSDSYKVNYKKSFRGIDFYEFDYIFDFAGKSMSINSFAMNNQSGTIVFQLPTKEFLVDFLSHCLESDEVVSLVGK